jgi:hypothetical protein
VPRRKSLSAGEFIRQLEADPGYVARREALDAATASARRAFAPAEAGLVAELRARGLPVASVDDFVQAGGAPPAAVPTLVAHLPRTADPHLWETIVRALSAPQAGAALAPLKTAYAAETDSHRRWLLANAIGSMARLADVRDLEGIEAYRALFRRSRKPPHVPPAP